MADGLDFETVEKLLSRPPPPPPRLPSPTSNEELDSSSSLNQKHLPSSTSPSLLSATAPSSSSIQKSSKASNQRSISPDSIAAMDAMNATKLQMERQKREEENRIKEEDARRKREIEEARRDDLTVLVLNLNLKADERNIYEFFAEHAGKVRDIQCIKDQRSGRAKGVAYVEFYTQESVIKALALSGQMLKGQPIRVQASQAEKNRAAKAAKIQQTELADGPMRIYVGGLVDALSNITSNELMQLFSPFGEVLGVDIQKDPYTGRSKGFAFIQFKHASEAKEAMSAMNGYALGGRPLRVGYATENARNEGGVYNGITGNSALSAEALLARQLAAQHAQQQQSDFQDSDRLDDDGGGLLSGASSKLALMQKLQRDGRSIVGNPASTVNPSDAMLAAAEQEAKALAGIAMANGMRTGAPTTPNAASSIPTNNLSCNMVLNNMFSPSEVDLKEDPDIFKDIMEDVHMECSKHGTVLQVWIKQYNPIDGKVWVKFESIDQALRAFQALNGRYFGGNSISIEFVAETLWQATCK